MIKKSDQQWLKAHIGTTYYLEESKNKDQVELKEHTPWGERQVMVLENPDKTKASELNPYIEIKILELIYKTRQSKWGKTTYNDYDLQDKWVKEVRSRKAKTKRKIKEGDRTVDAVFKSSTGERIA